MLTLTEDQWVAVRGRSARLSALWPRLTSTGKYAVAEAAVTDPAHAAVSSTLAAGTVETPAGYDDTLDTPAVLLGGRHMQVNCAEQPWSLQKPASNVYRFEVRANDFVTRTDGVNGTRRSELVSPYVKFTGTATGPDKGFFAGETAWQSWSAILGPHPGFLSPALQVGNSRFALGMQWHSDDSGVAARSPVLVVDYSNNAFRILTRSSASLTGSNGNPVVRYTAALPARGARVDIVLQATFGQTGHLNAWVNGVQVVNVDCPIGYYAADSPTKALGHPHFGIYTYNHNFNDVLYIANPEVSASSLSARIAAPLAVSDLSPWD